MVARSVSLHGIGSQQLLACALGDNNDCMFALPDPVAKGLKKTAGSVQLERYLRNETKVYLLTGQRGVAANEPEARPISFTKPIPLIAQIAST